MERLTVRKGNEVYVDFGDRIDITTKEMNRMIAERLAAYEDAEEQGRLVVLPCKVGNTVYVLTKKMTINTYNIGGAIIDTNNIWLDAKDGIYGGGLLNSLQFGVDVFLTREEAEKALEGMG